MSKKLVALALACVLAFTLAVPALADNETVVTGTYEEVPVAVTVPADTTATINPYALPVIIGQNASGGNVKVSGQQIVSLPMQLSNEGDVAMNVSVTVSATPKGGLKLVSAAPAATDTGKSAYVYLQILADATASDLAGLKGPEASASEIEQAVLAILSDSDTYGSYWDATQKIVFTAKEVEWKNVAVLAAATVTEATPGDATSETSTYNAGSIAVLRVAGNIVVSPKTAWNDTTIPATDTAAAIPPDGFEARIVFSFAPAL